MHGNLGACGQGKGQCAGNNGSLDPRQAAARGLVVVGTEVT